MLVIASCILDSCTRKPQENPTHPTDIGGSGGSAAIKITIKHHTKIIDSATVYIKYNTLDASSKYDDSVRCKLNDGKPLAIFSGLKKGNYYLYGVGWDPNITNTVVGGVPYTVKEETTYDINLPVTEGD